MSILSPSQRVAPADVLKATVEPTYWVSSPVRIDSDELKDLQIPLQVGNKICGQVSFDLASMKMGGQDVSGQPIELSGSDRQVSFVFSDRVI